MKRVYDKIIDELKKEDFSVVVKKYKLQPNELLGIIDSQIRQHLSKEKHLKNIFQENYLLRYFKPQKYGILADTHLGNSHAENWYKIDLAFDCFAKNNITTIIFLGDLWEGYMCASLSLSEKERIREERLDKFEKNYPKGFQTYLLLGNHDIEFQFGEHDLYSDIPTLRSDVIPLGAGGCYVSIRGKKVYLFHPVDNQMYPSLVPRAYDLKLSGHSHYFVFDQKEHSATIGACSNIMPYSGFAILSILNDEIIIDGYDVTDKEATRALKFKV